MAPLLDGGLKALLHGIVIDGERSRAIYDDPVPSASSASRWGNTFGGRREKILDDA